MGVLLELHVPDFAPVKDFYGDLGFRTVWERAPEGFKGYLVMRFENNALCFWCGSADVGEHPYFRTFPKDSPLGKGVEIVLTIADPEALYARLKGRPCVVEPFDKKPWGLYDFRIKDPYGYYIRITTPHDILSPEWAVP